MSGVLVERLCMSMSVKRLIKKGDYAELLQTKLTISSAPALLPKIRRVRERRGERATQCDSLQVSKQQKRLYCSVLPATIVCGVMEEVLALLLLLAAQLSP